MQKYLKKVPILTLVIAILAIGGASCGGGDEVAVEPYKIGAIFSTTGAASNLGVPEQQTVEMIVEQVNNKGGINGRSLEVIIYNDETDATRCVTMANRLIEQDKVLAIIGPSTTGNSLAIIDTVTTAQIPLVSCAAAASIIEPVEDRYWVFKTPQTDKEVVGTIYSHMQSEGITKVAVLTATSSFGVGGKKYLESEAASYGITIVANQTFDSDDTSMISQLTYIKGTDAQAVICWDTDKASAVVARDMQTLQVGVPLYCSHGVANPAFLAAAGDAANGVVLAAGKLLIVDELPDSDPQKEVLTKYRDDFEARFGEGTINTFGGHAWDALQMVIMALEELEDGLSLAESRASIRDSLENITGFVGISGIFTMSPTDHLGMQPGSLAMIEVVDGIWAPLQ